MYVTFKIYELYVNVEQPINQSMFTLGEKNKNVMFRLFIKCLVVGYMCLCTWLQPSCRPVTSFLQTSFQCMLMLRRILTDLIVDKQECNECLGQIKRL